MIYECHTGHVGGIAAMPEVTFDSEAKRNRVDGSEYGFSGFARNRLKNINTNCLMACCPYLRYFELLVSSFLKSRWMIFILVMISCGVAIEMKGLVLWLQVEV